MSITGFNRRRRELAKQQEIAKQQELEQQELANGEINYSKLKVDELKAIANEKGIEFDSKITKAELIEELEKLG